MASRLFRSAFDDYKIGRQIGQGGTGFVVEAANQAGEALALKYLDPQKIRSQQRKRFQNEILFGQRAAHPNIIRTLDFGQAEVNRAPTPFYVMPRYDLSLREALKRGFAAATAVSIFEKILHGVQAAHLSSVWHRDLKPENILLSSDLKEVVVADFGIAHFAELDYYTAAETKAADRLANYRYYAPEQLDPIAQRDHRVDIFALGLMLNELFTRQVPRGSQPPLIATAAPEFAHLDELVQFMTRHEANARPSSIQEVKRELAARARIQVAEQRYDQIKKTVVSETEPDDPVIREPIQIVDEDWENGVLSLKLSYAPPAHWKEIFTQGYRVPMTFGTSPELGRWTGSSTQFLISARGEDAKSVVGAYRKHVQNVNHDYAEFARREHLEKVAQERHEREQATARAAERARVLKALKGG